MVLSDVSRGGRAMEKGGQGDIMDARDENV